MSSARAVAAVTCFWLLACTKSVPRAPAAVTVSTCPKPSGESFTARFYGHPEQFRELLIVDYSRPFEPLRPGRYNLSVSGECYAATARFTLDPPATERPVSVEGDLDLVGHETNVTGLVVPAHPDTVKVRIERNGTVVLDQIVSEASECAPKELAEEPGDERPRYEAGLCIFVRKEESVDLCPDESPVLVFRLHDGSRWQDGRDYELELTQDGTRTSCEFEVPLPEADTQAPALACSLSSSDIREPSGVTLTGSPANVTVRIRAGGALLFEGSTALRYSDDPNSCKLSELIDLRPAKSDRR